MHASISLNIMLVRKEGYLIATLLLAFWIGQLDATDSELCRDHGSTLECKIPSNSSNPNGYYDSESLQAIALKASNKKFESVIISIGKRRVHLKNNVSFSSLLSLSITGSSSLGTLIDCGDSNNISGITFNNIMNLTMIKLSLIHCSSRRRLKNHTYSSALTLDSCGHVNITQLTIQRSLGIGLTILNHQKGTVHISHSNFTHNKLPEELKSNIRGGGGVYIGDFQPPTESPVSFEFEHCIFDSNEAHTRHYDSLFVDEFGQFRGGYGHGGGVFVAFENDIVNCSLVNVAFSNCTFTKNLAFIGSGLSVKIGKGSMPKSMTKVAVTVMDSTFEHNGHTTSTSYGGAASLGYHPMKEGGHKYSFKNVTFLNNSAALGGGTFFYSYKQNSLLHFLSFDNCTFKGNKGHTGSAVDMVPSGFVKLSTNLNTVPVFKDCIFLENTVLTHSESHNTQRTPGIGTVYSSHYDLKFERHNHFENNVGSAVYIVNGVANFSESSAEFENNVGIRGGALALIGSSSVMVGPNREYHFRNNSALFQGGAIFKQMIDIHDFTFSRGCFIQYFDNNIDNYSITFRDNRARVGHAIFATSLHPCRFITNNTESKSFIVSASEVFSSLNIDINQNDIVTDGARLRPKNKNLKMIPGKKYKHNVAIYDDRDINVSEPLRANIRNYMPPRSVLMIDSTSSSYVEQNIQLKGKPHDEVNVTFQTVSTRQAYVNLLITMDECPPGFKLKNRICQCSSKEYYGLLECDEIQFNSFLLPGLWVGEVMDETDGHVELATSICPRTFCDYNNTFTDSETIASVIRLPLKTSELQEAICGGKRKGILCGKCTENYTTHFHSPDYSCKHARLCEVGWLFYILSELIPTTALFMIVIVFNISFTSGAVNGFILFSQVLLSLNIDGSGVITFPNKSSIIKGYQLLYGFFNLDFFTIDTFSFCLWPNATALHMLAFKYVTIVYALSLVILVIWFMNKCGGRCLGRWCRITTVKSSIIHGVSAFFIICYSQSIIVSHSLLSSAVLWLKTDSNLSIYTRVWHDGNVRFFSKEHLPYALPALLCLLTIGVLPPILLLVYPLCNKVLAFFGLEESRLVTFFSHKLPIGSMKPLFDSFQGCFKDNLRFFAGFYFLYRWTSPIVNSATSSLGTAYITSEVLLILMLLLHALFQPYRKRVHNVVDTLLFTNLLLINSITCIHLFLFQSQENRHTAKEKVAKTAVIQAILIYLPILVMALYLLVVGIKCVYAYYLDLNFNREQGDIVGEENVRPITQAKRKLRALLLQSTHSTGKQLNDEDLPHRLISEEVSYECFEDVDYAQEMHTQNKSRETELL